MDASKAFDKINHHHLFRKLIRRKLPTIVIRMFQYWFRTQTFRVRWSNVLSQSFSVRNGVRQGGILSPYFYNVFVDELSKRLHRSSIGCSIEGFPMNHILYADDSVVLAPSPAALQKLLNICDEYAAANEITFNCTKTVCMSVLPHTLKDLRVPDLHLKNSKLEWIKTKKYLGVFFTDNGKDKKDINREKCCTYARGNILIRKFSNCSEGVKLDLFKSYCTQFHASALWCNYSDDDMSKLRVAFNNVFKRLFNIKGYVSFSNIFMNVGLDTVPVLLRKSMFNLRSRLMKSFNVILQAVVKSYFFQNKSSLNRHWNANLYV